MSMIRDPQGGREVPPFAPTIGGHYKQPDQPSVGPKSRILPTFGPDAIKHFHIYGGLAARIPGFYPKEACQNLSDCLLRDQRRTSYVGAPQVQCVASSLFEAALSPEASESYWAQVNGGFDANRACAAPFIFPTDLVRLRADEFHPAGASILRLEDRTCWSGLARVLEKTAAINPHVDSLADDIPESADAALIKFPIAANIHLQTAEEGGELEVFDFFPTSEQVRELGSSYGLPREVLPPPAVVIKPEVGDLILHAALAVHAVRAVRGTRPRVTASCFIGLDPRGVLRFWS